MHKILITGCAGFVGFHLARRLLVDGAVVVGFDNLNDYYDVSLKEARLALLREHSRFSFVRGELADADSVMRVFENVRPSVVVNLAAQAGVRYSIENPKVYMDSNMMGFFNVLEACRRFVPEHLVYASSSSVYGNQGKVPFSTDDNVDHPISLYAATKKANELMAYTYSHLYGIPATGLRLFTVYGPWGRPDMAYFSFARKMLAGETINVYGNGGLWRDFTYIDDIVDGIVAMLGRAPLADASGVRYKVYNIGNSTPVLLTDFIATLETAFGTKVQRRFLPMQPGDVRQTFADVSGLERDFGFRPGTPLNVGIGRFAEWYLGFYEHR